MVRQRRLVYVSGAPGAGKTSLAGPLAAALGYALLTKDTIKETLHDALGAPEPDLAWSRRLGGAAMELLWALAARAPAVVIEANFRPHSEYERGRFAELGGCPVEVYCQCPAEVALTRYNTRPTHPVHVLKTLPLEALAEYAVPGRHRRADHGRHDRPGRRGGRGRSRSRLPRRGLIALRASCCYQCRGLRSGLRARPC